METSSLMSENGLHSIPLLRWPLRVGDLLILPIFLISELLGVGQSIWQNVHHPLYGLTFLSIWGSGPHRSDPSSFSPSDSVGSFPDTSIGVSGPAAIIALQIWPHFFLILVLGSKAPYSGHHMSSPCHNVHPKS